MNKLKIVITTLLLLFPFFMFSQSIENLENVGGFKEIKIGDSKNKWQQFLKRDITSNYDDYFLNGSYFNSAFGHEIKSVLLRFSPENKVQFIMISLKNQLNITGVSTLQESIVEAFGESTGNRDNPPLAFVKFWKASNVTLAMDAAYNPSNSLYFIMLTYVDNKFYEKTNKSSSDY